VKVNVKVIKRATIRQRKARGMRKVEVVQGENSIKEGTDRVRRGGVWLEKSHGQKRGGKEQGTSGILDVESWRSFK